MYKQLLRDISWLQATFSITRELTCGLFTQVDTINIDTTLVSLYCHMCLLTFLKTNINNANTKILKSVLTQYIFECTTHVQEELFHMIII